ncbi:MAG: YadA-like family protein [Rhodanobacter sp.]
MNRIYRLVWCRSLGALVVASELAASGRAGGSSRGTAGTHAWLRYAAILGAIGLFPFSAAHAQSAGDAKLADLQSLMAKYDDSRPAAETAAPVVVGHSAVPAVRIAQHAAASAGAWSHPAHRPARLAVAEAAKADVRSRNTTAHAAAVAELHAHVAVSATVGGTAGTHPVALPAAPLADAAPPARPQASGLRLADTVSGRRPALPAKDGTGKRKPATHRGAANDADLAATDDSALSRSRDLGFGVTAGVSARASLPLAIREPLPLAGLLAPVSSAVANIVPVVPAPGPAPTGLIVGNGGVVGTAVELLGPSANSLFNNSSGYVSNGSLRVNNANFTQGYSTLSALGIPLLNLTPVGTLLTSTGGDVVGGTGINSHLTLLGGVTSDSYIRNVNNGAAGGLLGVVLPDSAPAWASTCLNVLGVLTESCWGVNAAQDYQVLVGDGASANGSKEVVIGTNASHTLATVDASTAFPGDGSNDPDNPSGVPTADYEARLGHSVVIGDDASGTANAQTIVGAEATASVANSVALGYRSAADRGAVSGYAAFGLAAPQDSAGEVSVGAAGQERQITHVAAGSASTDAVNVAQLEGVAAVAGNSVQYDDATSTSVTLAGPASSDGGATGGTKISNLRQGELSATSTDAVNGAQLFATNDMLTNIYDDGTKYFHANSSAADSMAIGADSIAIGTGSQAVSESSIAIGKGAVAGDSSDLTRVREVAIGNGAKATAQNTVAVGDGALANGPQSTAVGSNAQATVAQATALGRNATAGNNGTALGMNAQATGLRSTAVGQGAQAAVTDATSVGQFASVTSAGGVALGVGSMADRAAMAGAAELFSGTAVSSAAGALSVGAAGAERQITNVAGGTQDTDAVNVRQLRAVNDQVQSVDQLAVKYDADVNGDPLNRISLVGDGSGADVGITHLAAGNVAAGSTDAINGSQLAATNAAVVDFFGGTTAFDPASGIWTAPTFSITSIDANGGASSSDYDNVTDAFAAVDGSLNNVNNRIDNIDNGGGIKYFHAKSALADSSATGDDSVAVGGAAQAGGDSSVALGKGADASAADAMAFGTGATASLANSIALGAGSATQVGALGNYTAYGLAAPQSSLGEVNLGNRQITGVAAGSAAGDAVNVAQLQAVDNHVQSLGKLAVKYDADPAGNAVNTITLLGDGSGAPVGIFNVAAGAEAAASHDAVNGSQLWHWTQDTSNVYSNYSLYNDITHLAQGAGKVKYLNVNSTLGDSSASGSDSIALGPVAKAGGSNSVAVGNGATADADNSVAIGSASVADRANTVSVGSDGNERQITNVAAGTQGTDAVNVDQLNAVTASTKGTVHYATRSDGSIDYGDVTLGNGSGATSVHNVAAGVADSDAVNVGQLNGGVQQAVNWANSYTDHQIRELGNRANAGVASAMAMAGLPQAYEPGKSMAAVSAGSFRGESSLAIGVSTISEGGRWVYKLTGTTDTRGDTGVSIGAGIQW